MTTMPLYPVQVPGPPGCEDRTRAFYSGVLGMGEVERPEALRPRDPVGNRLGLQQATD